jgi:hypothetical protein
MLDNFFPEGVGNMAGDEASDDGRDAEWAKF